MLLPDNSTTDYSFTRGTIWIVLYNNNCSKSHSKKTFEILTVKDLSTLNKCQPVLFNIHTKVLINLQDCKVYSQKVSLCSFQVQIMFSNLHSCILLFILKFCFTEWKADDIIILCFVSLAAAIIVGIAIFICIQRYRAFMSSQMNFVLSYVPKASQQIRKFAPIMLPKTSVALKKLGTAGKETDSESNPAAPTSEIVLTSATEPTSATAPSTETATTSSTQPMSTLEAITNPQSANAWWTKWWR